LRCVAAVIHRWELFRKMIWSATINETRNRLWNGSVNTGILMRDEIDPKRRIDILERSILC
jgi:hypothetical protein